MGCRYSNPQVSMSFLPSLWLFSRTKVFWPTLTFSVIRLASGEFYVFTTSVPHRCLCPYHCVPLLVIVCTVCFAYDFTYSTESKTQQQQWISAYFYLPRSLHSADTYRNLSISQHTLKALHTISWNAFSLYKYFSKTQLLGPVTL
jgi:hypothetical protein